MKRFLFWMILVSTLMCFSPRQTLAEEDQQTVKVTAVSAGPVVDITIPLNVSMEINTNSEAVATGNFTLSNSSKSSMKIILQEIKCVCGFSTLVAPDGLPDGVTWESLNREKSDKYFCIGVKPIDNEYSQWRTKIDYYVYAGPQFRPTVIGTIDANSYAPVTLDIRCGKAFTREKHAEFQIILLAELE